jgi:nitrite reductase (NADH) large subunit
VGGCDLLSPVSFPSGAGTETIVLQDRASGVYKKLILRDNRIDGAVLYGDTGDGPWYVRLMRERTDVSSFRHRVMFGQSPADEGGRRAVA